MQIRHHLRALARLPRKWTLLYSLDQHGISLNTLYARCEFPPPGVGQPSPRGSLLILKDAGDALFGVWMGESGLHPSRGKGYYGGGDSFVWKYVDGKFEVFKWTGRNDYVALCEPDYISFGGGWVFLSSRPDSAGLRLFADWFSTVGTGIMGCTLTSLYWMGLAPAV